ncbi:hypothetical protein [Puniceibacterium sp. IMCC21224]|uniref:hypothetical protein n=1 Tax=Puniceibacterium sp. IMCC21224 TaxID=1618204 RepID=UPI0012DFEBC3|nr:hypothetical protein [Puniceibacterium sp. IMCC21224]
MTQLNISAALYAAGLVSPFMPQPPVRHSRRRSSGKDRAKIKAARKQRRRGK